MLGETNGKISDGHGIQCSCYSPAFEALAYRQVLYQAGPHFRSNPSKILEADINTDGFLDLLVLSGGKKIAWVENKGQRVFSFSSTSNVILVILPSAKKWLIWRLILISMVI